MEMMGKASQQKGIHYQETLGSISVNPKKPQLKTTGKHDRVYVSDKQGLEHFVGKRATHKTLSKMKCVILSEAAAQKKSTDAPTYQGHGLDPQPTSSSTTTCSEIEGSTVAKPQPLTPVQATRVAAIYFLSKLKTDQKHKKIILNFKNYLCGLSTNKIKRIDDLHEKSLTALLSRCGM